jgi:hypothetical protein
MSLHMSMGARRNYKLAIMLGAVEPTVEQATNVPLTILYRPESIGNILRPIVHPVGRVEFGELSRKPCEPDCRGLP